MDLSTAMQSINLWAVLVGALISFILGAIWYNPKVFGTAWMRENKLKEEDFEGQNQGMIFGLAFVLYIISSFILAMFIGNEGIVFGALAGLLTALAFIGTTIGINYLFERKSVKLWIINVGYSVATYVIMGAILGAWK